MVRYKRRSYGRRRRSTNVVKMKIQSFMDVSTSDSSMQIVTISAGGKDIFRRLSAQFLAYKYYKIGNISVKLVPASTLPVDPTGLSYEAGAQTVDPRDQLTPGLMRITNGEDVFENISGLSDGQQHGIYNNMLLDPRWFKWMLQSGVKRHATPRYWQIGQLHQDKWPGVVTNLPGLNSSDAMLGTYQEWRSVQPSVKTNAPIIEGSSPYGFFQTGHRGVLGWLPTDGLQHMVNAAGDGFIDKPLLASPPEVEVMKLILPKAYKTTYYYRMFITETVYFKEPIVTFGVPYGGSYMYRPLDIFHTLPVANPMTPNTDGFQDYPSNGQSGGNYGDS